MVLSRVSSRVSSVKVLPESSARPACVDDGGLTLSESFEAAPGAFWSAVRDIIADDGIAGVSTFLQLKSVRYPEPWRAFLSVVTLSDLASVPDVGAVVWCPRYARYAVVESVEFDSVRVRLYGSHGPLCSDLLPASECWLSEVEHSGAAVPASSPASIFAGLRRPASVR